MTLIGVDLNATRARALHGTAAGPATLTLEAGQAELPLALSLENRAPAVGRAGVGLCRKLPHLACLDFLAYLETDRQWSAGRHRLDAAAAFALVCQQLQPRFAKATGIVMALPAYFSEGQAELATRIAEQAKWTVLGATSMPLAAVLAAQEYIPWHGLVLVIDADGHAMSWSAVAVGDERAHVVDVRISPKLGLGYWHQALRDGVARRCVRMSRRDPRASAESEQSLHEQLLAVLERNPRGDTVELNIQSPQWYQNLMLPVEELSVFTAPLAELARTEMTEFVNGLTASGPLGAVILTAAAACLPGLAAALERPTHQADSEVVADAESDFGEGLLDDRCLAPTHLLDPDAVARAAFELAVRCHRGELTPGWLAEIPFPAPEATQVHSGPARLQYRGEDYLIAGPCFTMGRDPASDLVFDSDAHPSVSARHCEIAREQRGFIVRDRSRHGTFLNDRPVNGQAGLKAGDWIRLGPGGPLLRFLGQPADPFQLVTTA